MVNKLECLKNMSTMIDSMVSFTGSMHKKSFSKDSKYKLAYLGTDTVSKEELLDDLNNGVFSR